MGSITLTQICSAIRTTLATATGLTYAQAPADIQEGIHDYPLLQVYPERGETDPSGNADRTTFRAGVRQSLITVNADLYARPRQHIGEDFDALLPLVDAVIDVLEAQDTKPYFGLEGIKGFHWSWQRVSFVYGDPQQPFIGCRFTLTLRVF